MHGFALDGAGRLWSGDLDRAAEALATGRVLASGTRLSLYELLARALTGQLHALRGDLESGIALLSEGLAGLVEVSHLTMNSALQLALAEALIEAGRPGEALAEAVSALVRIERDEELTLVPEAWRIKGRALARSASGDRAEEAFRHALQIAQDQGALSYRLEPRRISPSTPPAGSYRRGARPALARLRCADGGPFHPGCPEGDAPSRAPDA